MGDIGVSFLSSAIYDVLKFIFCKSIDEAQLYKIDKTIKAEIYKKYYDKMLNKEITKVEMAKLLGVGRATLYRWIKLYEED